jgi:hypothetical protein
MKLEIDKTLVLSTAHVTPETAAILNEGIESQGPMISGHVADWSDYGWVMWCGGETDPKIETEDNEGLLPADVHGALMFARKHGCQYVRFDCDADTVDDLPTWEW